MLKKKLVILNTTILLGLGSVFALPSALAQGNLGNIKAERSGIQAKISSSDQTLQLVQQELSKLSEKIERVDQAIEDNNNMINNTETNIEETKAEVAQLKKEIAILEDSIEKRTEILKKRAQSYQESGGSVSYLDVLVGSESFSNFVDRVVAVAQIAQADRTLITENESDKKSLEEKQSKVEIDLAGLKEKQSDLKAMHGQLKEQKQQNDEMKNELKEKEQKVSEFKTLLQNKDASLAEAEKKIKQEILNSQTKTVAVHTTKDSSDSNANQTSPVISSPRQSFNSSSTDREDKVVSSAPRASSGTANDVLSAGNKYIGNSVYVFGGGRTAADIANGRFDCSGFVHYAFAQAGISVGSSTDSLKYSGTQVSSSNMRPGDLVFFDTYKKDGHVGIYAGGGKFLGSQSSTGVAYANMTSGYWKQKFNGRVVRIIQ